MAQELTWVDELVNSLGPTGKNQLNLIATRYYLLAVLPMWFLLNPLDPL